MAEHVVTWFRRQGWEVYEEVEYDSARADIVAVRGPLLHVVECKVAFGLAVLEQAHHWIRYTNLVSVATPFGSGRGRLSRDVCARLGVGWLCAGLGEVEERVAPQIRRRVSDKLRLILRPEHQTYARAGTNGGYFTAWRATTERLRELVRAEPGLTIKDIVDRIPHHYATAKSARTHLLRDVEAGRIPGVDARKYDWSTTLRIYPTPPPQPGGA